MSITRQIIRSLQFSDDNDFTLTALYLPTLKPDPKIVKAREKKLAELKIMMGDKYLLAVHKGRINAVK